MSIMKAAFMAAIADIDGSSPEAVYLAKHGSMDEAIALVAAQLAHTRHVETRDLIESSEPRYGFDKSVYEPSPCITISAKAVKPNTLSYNERFANLQRRLS